MRTCIECGKVEQPNQRFLPYVTIRGDYVSVCTAEHLQNVYNREIAELRKIEQEHFRKLSA